MQFCINLVESLRGCPLVKGWPAVTTPINYEEAPNVVSEEGCRKLVASGWQLQVFCAGSAEKKHQNYFGTWGIRIISPDGTYERTLVTARKDMQMRMFKTVNGLIAFLYDLNVKVPSIPLEQGMRALQPVIREEVSPSSS